MNPEIQEKMNARFAFQKQMYRHFELLGLRDLALDQAVDDATTRWELTQPISNAEVRQELQSIQAEIY